MREKRLVLPSLHPGQTQIVSERRRFNVAVMGRRWGKTRFGIRAAAHPVLDGCPVGWFAPNYKFLTEAWRQLRYALAPITSSVNKSERRIELITGGSLDFWSLTDDDAGRSYKYKRVIVDEAGLVKNLETAWNEGIRPTLTDLKGDAWFLGTPKGRGYFFTLFGQGQDAFVEDWASWQKPTITNPTIPDLAEEIEAARRGMPERSFQQEYEAVFLEDGGGVFRGVLAAIDKGRKDNDPPQPGMSYTLGVDLARVEDFTVLIVLDKTGRQVYFDRFNQISWERQIGEIVKVANLYRANVVIDSTGAGDPIWEQVRKGYRGTVTGFTITASSKEPLIDNLAIAIEQGRLRLLDNAVQTNELQSYQYEVTPARNVRMSAPAGMHDDCVIALALAEEGRRVTTGKPATAKRAVTVRDQYAPNLRY
jgi:hypothetical protein